MSKSVRNGQHRQLYSRLQGQHQLFSPQLYRTVHRVANSIFVQTGQTQCRVLPHILRRVPATLLHKALESGVDNRTQLPRPSSAIHSSFATKPIVVHASNLLQDLPGGVSQKQRRAVRSNQAGTPHHRTIRHRSQVEFMWARYHDITRTCPCSSRLPQVGVVFKQLTKVMHNI